MALEEVFEGRKLRTLGVAGLLGLLELLRVPQEHQVRRRLGASENVGQRHLPRFVHEQHIDGSRQGFPRPDPRGPADHVVIPIQDHPDGTPRVRLLVDPGDRFLGLLLDPMHAADGNLLVGGSPDHLFQQIPDHLVADRGDSNPSPLANQIHDHPRAGEGLARARWSLDGEHTPVERKADPACAGDGRFSGFAQRRAGNEPRVEPQQEVASGPVRPRSIDPVVAHELAKPQQGVHGLRIGNLVVLEYGGGMAARARRPLAQIDRSMLEVDRLDLAKSRRRLASRLVYLVPFIETRVLRRELVAIDSTSSFRRPQAFHELEPREAIWLVEELVVGHPVESEVFPPVDLVLASMPLEELSEDPLSLLFAGSPCWKTRGKCLRDRTDAREPLGELLAGLGDRLGRARHWMAVSSLYLQAQPLEPLAQLESRDAVVLVVRLDRLLDLRRQRAGVSPCDRILDRPELPRGLPEIHLARQPIERLELLDRVAVDARSQTLTNHAIEVDEDLGAQQLIELVGAGGIPSHEPLHRGRFVGRVVIDVHRRVVAATLEDRIDESLERLLFFVRRQRPELLVTNATAAVTEGVPEEVVEAAVLRLPIAFEIQKDVER